MTAKTLKPYDGFTGNNDGRHDPQGRSCPYCARYEPTHAEDCAFYKRTTALTELEGFTKRNVERAKKALAEAQKIHRYQAEMGAVGHELVEARARLHDAERFHLVVSERVREALK